MSPLSPTDVVRELIALAVVEHTHTPAAVATVLTELVWGGRGSLGPSLASGACPAFAFTSRRDGEACTQRFEHGVPVGQSERTGTTTATGTVIRCTTDGPVDAAAIDRFVAELRRRIGGPAIELQA